MTNLSKELSNKKEARDLFLKLSYDVKNPLSVCYGYLEIMKKEKQYNEEYIELIKNELDKSIKIIDDFKSKIEK